MNTPREKIGWARVPRVEDYFPLSRPVSKPVKLCAFMRTNIKSFFITNGPSFGCLQKNIYSSAECPWPRRTNLNEFSFYFIFLDGKGS